MSPTGNQPTQIPDALALMSGSAPPLDVTSMGKARPIPALLGSAVGCLVLSGVVLSSGGDSESYYPPELLVAAGLVAVSGACLLAALVLAARRLPSADLAEILRQGSVAKET